MELVIEDLLAQVAGIIDGHQRLQTALDTNQGSGKRLNESELMRFCRVNKLVGGNLWERFDTERGKHRISENYSLGDYVRSVLAAAAA